MLYDTERLDQYIQNTRRIRALSRPNPEEMDSETAYSQVLRANFTQIGKIAQDNRAILSDVLEPMLRPEGELCEETIEQLNRFSEQLLDASSIQNLDIPLSHMVSSSLFEAVMRTDNTEWKLRQADNVITTSYSMINLIKRLGFGSQLIRSYQEYGFRAAEYVRQFFSKEALSSIPEDLRHLVVIDSRYITCLYEGSMADLDCCQEQIEMLQRSAAIGADPEIRSMVPDYDWRYHQFRIMEYTGAICEHNNSRGCTLAQRRYMSEVSDRLLETWDSDPQYYSRISPRIYVRIQAMLCRYLSGRTDRDTYLKELVLLYQECEKGKNRFSAAETVHYLIRIPLLYIYALKRPSGFVTEETDYTEANRPAEPLTGEQIETLTHFYHKIAKRTLYAIESGSLSYLLEFLSMLLMHFIEVPKVSFQQFCLSVMCVLHPPTYVHSMMVGEISECLCRHVLERCPQQLIGVNQYQTVREVVSEREMILSQIRNAALCHDFGKLPLIDLIFLYERRLFDFEFDLIRQHPCLSAEMLERASGAQIYQEIAKGHHRWYDDSAGYPETVSVKNSSCRALISIVTVADCMDAATDSIGRSYNSGKTLDEYIAEVEAQSGSRYAPWLADLLGQPEVKEELGQILKLMREKYYKKAYRRLTRKSRSKRKHTRKNHRASGRIGSLKKGTVESIS